MSSTSLVTGEVRISYEHLLQPYAHQQGQEPKYSATLLIPKSDTNTKQLIDAAVQAAIQEGVSGRWGGAKPAQPHVPLHDGDGLRPNGEPFGEECKGHWVMTASSKQQQDVVDANRMPILDSTQVYSGMFAKVYINFFAYNAAGRKGIGCGLGPVMKTRDGEALGGRVTASDVFGGAQTSEPIPFAPQQTPQPYNPQQYIPQPQQTPQQSPQQAPQQTAYDIDPITGLPNNGVLGF